MSRGRKPKVQLDEDEGDDAPVAVQDARLDQATAEYRRLLELPDNAYSHLRQVQLAAQLMWALRADSMFVRGDHDAARKAAMTASEHGKLAARLERDSIVDRVAAIEAEINIRRSFGSDLRALKEAES